MVSYQSPVGTRQHPPPSQLWMRCMTLWSLAAIIAFLIVLLTV